jgi:RnfABCDGE-type electron transport complex B subunit
MSIGTILVSAAILGGVGLTFGTLIAVVHRRFRVDEDPRIDVLVGLLPGTNCGACGQAGCRAFAESLVTGSITPAECTVMGAEDVTDVAGYLGVDAGEANRRVARLLCAGGCDVAPKTGNYVGLETCAAAAAVAGGGKACPWGCLGLADCQVVCDFDAIVMNGQDLPVVIPEKCTACGDCVEACPKDLFEIMPLEQRLIVQCKNLLDGPRAESVCAVACNGCGKCALDAETGVITIADGLAVVDYDKNDLTSPDAIARCPTGAIVWLEGQQFAATSTPTREGVLV